MSDTSSTMVKWIQLVFEKGSLGVLAAGGVTALWRGLFPSFEVRQAVFGASLLCVGALSEVVVWIVKQRSAEKQLDQAFAIRNEGQALYLEASRALRQINESSPGSKGVQSSDLVPTGNQ